MAIFSIYNTQKHKVISIFYCKFKVKRTFFYNIKNNLKLFFTHSWTFLKYLNRNKNKDTYIIATGPTLKYYIQKKNNNIFIGVNKSFLTDIKLDYLFMQDYLAVKDYIDKCHLHHSKKFFGHFIDKRNPQCIAIPKHLCKSCKAELYYSNFPNENIYKNIFIHPLMDFSSVVFPAIHFALFSGAKRIFLVGCDCSNNGYYDKTKQNVTLDFNKTLLGYKYLKNFIKKNYPTTEIISVNPIGLKGLFKDVYTEEYLKKYPVKESNVEILEN